MMQIIGYNYDLVVRRVKFRGFLLLKHANYKIKNIFEGTCGKKAPVSQVKVTIVHFIIWLQYVLREYTVPTNILMIGKYNVTFVHHVATLCTTQCSMSTL